MALFQEKIALTLVLFLLASFIGGLFIMQADNQGQMGKCPFMAMESLCQMGLFEHLRAFRDAFSGIAAKMFLLAVLALFLTIFLTTAPKIKAALHPFSLFLRENWDHPHFNKILLALSDGLIQPKLYA